MTVLGFDTATDLTTVAVTTDGSDFFESASPRESRSRMPTHSQELLPKIAEVLQSAGISLEQIDVLAVGVGPGTYTGLRIGVATARALAQSLDIPLVPVSTLAATALGIVESAAAADVVLPVLDAKRSEVFSCAYAANGGRTGSPVRSLTEEFVTEPAAITGKLGDIKAVRCTAAGDGAIRYGAELREAGIRVLDEEASSKMVKGRNICRLALVSETVAIEKVVPNYLRLPDAELTLRAGKLNI